MVTGVKEELTKAQDAIYRLLTEENLSVKEIAERRNVSLQAVYGVLSALVSKGWLKKEYTANFSKVQ